MKNLPNALLQPTSLVEILFLTLVFFVVLNFIRGTRGAIILKGIIFVFVIAFVGILSLASAFGLEHIVQLFKWFLSISFIAVIVVFAPEIRRGLSRIAQSPLFIRFVKERPDKAIREVVDAAFNLSRKRIGCLIAIERETQIGDLEHSVKLDADVTAELIETIFYPGSPLHDGGIVIRDQKIVAAACIFPNSESPDIPKELGTRHRAAVGITEETDAIAVVVSEETGRVSVCVRGQITLGLDRERLFELLSDLYKIGTEEPGLLRLVKRTRRLLSRPKPEVEKVTVPEEQERKA